MANIVDKYLNKKKKQIFDYCKSVNEFLVYNNNQIWKTPIELNDMLKDIISIYVDKYYFKVLDNFDNYKDYLGALTKSDNRFKTILVCTFEYIPSKLKIDNYKISSYIISLIIYTAVILDRFTYPYNNYKVNMKNIESVITPMFSAVSFVEYKENKKKLKNITNEIKANDFLEKDLILALDKLNTDESKNEYECIDKENKLYKANYKYSMPELNEFRGKDIKKYFKRIEDDLKCVSFELATITALKIKMLNKDIMILFPIELDVYSNEMEINKLSKLLENQQVKSVIRLYIKYHDYKEHFGSIRLLSNAGFKIALNFEDSVEVPYTAFNDIKLVIVNHDFIDLNKGNIASWSDTGITFIEKSLISNDEISELKMLGLEG